MSLIVLPSQPPAVPGPAQLFFQAEMPAGEILSLGSGSAVVFSSRSPDKISPNEDAAAVVALSADAAVLAVADGMGGMPSGERAARVALERLAECVAGAPPEGMRAAILNGMEAANHAVGSLGFGAATTLVVAEVRGSVVRTYHAGDSMILLVGQRGKIKHQTVCHSPVGYALLAGLLDEAAAMHHEDRHLVSNFVGTPEMRIELGPPLRMNPRDTLLLASDGLFDNLHIDEIAQRIRTGSLGRVADRLAADCRARMLHPQPDQPSKADDLTFIAYRRWRSRSDLPGERPAKPRAVRGGKEPALALPMESASANAPSVHSTPGETTSEPNPAQSQPAADVSPAIDGQQIYR